MPVIEKTFEFSAAHRLALLPAEHKCSRIHGHGYRVTVRITSGLLDPVGMILDYAELDPFAGWLKDECDHRWLGHGLLTDEAGEKTEPAFDANPTAECLAAWFRDVITGGLIPGLAGGPGSVRDVTVGVSETGRTWAWA
jgi:6-pyruvoyltetrahydropterin/6-carboxytetrahydropterin synthase